MGGQRQQIHAERAYIDGNLADRLHGIGVYEGAVLVRDLRERGDRLDGAKLVVRVHDRHDHRVVGDELPQAIRRGDAGLIDGDERRAPPAPRERLQRVQYGLVFNGARDEVTTAGWLERVTYSSCTADRKIVRLGAAAGEHHFRGIAVDERSDGRPRLVEHRFGLLPEVMHARRVAELVAGDAHDRLHHLRGERRRGVVVKIDTHQ